MRGGNKLPTVFLMVAVFGVFVLAFLYLGGGGIPSSVPLECQFSGDCKKVLFEFKLNKGFLADPNIEYAMVQEDRPIAQSVIPLDFVPNSVDLKMKITEEGFEAFTWPCHIEREGGNCIVRYRKSYLPSEFGTHSFVFELYDSVSGSSWGDTAHCSYSISQAGVTLTGGDGLCR